MLLKPQEEITGSLYGPSVTLTVRESRKDKQQWQQIPRSGAWTSSAGGGIHGTSLFKSLPLTADKHLPLNHLLVTHLNNASHRGEGFSDTRRTNLWRGRLSSSQLHNKWIKDKNWARALLWGRSKAQSTEIFLSPKLRGWTTTVAAMRCPWKQ